MARRVVSVELLAKVFKYRKDMASADQSTAQLTDTVEELGKKSTTEFAKFDAGAHEAGDAADGLTHDLHQLERQIADTEHQLKALNREFALTQAASTKRLIKSGERDLAFLQKVRKSLTEVGDEAGKVGKTAGKQLAGGFSDTLQALPAQIRGAGMLIIAGLAVSLSPVIGSAIGGAVLGGVGVGGIIGGIAAASRDPRVQEAAEDLGTRFMEKLDKAAAPFTENLLLSMEQVEAASDLLTISLGKGFRQLAPLLQPVIQGVKGLIANLGPGLEEFFGDAAPAVRAIARELPEIGDAISDALKSIGDESDGATEALIGMLNVLEAFIRITGAVVGGLSAMFEWLVKVEGKVLDIAEEIPLFGPFTAALHTGAEGAKILQKDLDKAKDSSNDFADGLTSSAKAARDAAAKVRELTDAIDDLFDKQMQIDEATIAYKQGLRELREELTHGKRTLSLNTEEGLKNRSAILDQIKAIEQLRDANIANGDTLDVANGKYAQQLESLRKTLLNLGYNADAVNTLIDSYKGIPAKASTSVQAPGLSATESRLKRVENLLDRLDGRYVKATILLEQEYHREEARQNRRWGGITEHARDGLLKEAGIYSSKFPARYAYAEPSTGGEAFVPRYGDYERSMGILNQAARWYGGMVVPQNSQPTAQPSSISPQALASAVRAALQGMGIYLDGHAVGQVSGRRAEVLRRGN